MNAHHVRRMVMAAGFGLAAGMCHGQWFSQLLNSSAATNASGQMIVLHDGGGAWGGGNMTADKAFDGNSGTYYDAITPQGAWLGFGLQMPKLITGIRYTGRTSYGYRIVGTLVQGANMSDFSDAVTLWTLSPPDTWNPTQWRSEHFLNPAAATNTFRYVRLYCQGEFSYGGDFSRVEIYGADPMSGPVPPPGTPALTFADSINWHMNLRWGGLPSDVILYEIHRKIAHEGDFSPFSGAYATSGEMNFCDESLMLYQDTEYRIRAVNAAGVSAWTNVTALARNSAVGQLLGTPGSYGNNGNTGAKAFDGNVMTDVNATTANGFWTGMDFGAPREVTALRFMPRRTLASRMRDGRFEVADNPDFVNAATFYAIPNTSPPENAVTEVTAFTQPMTAARYVRYYPANGQYGDVAELEFVLATTPPLPPNGLAVAGSDITNAYAVLTWRTADVTSLMSSVMVHRATSPGGPYTPLTPDGLLPSVTTWTDTAVAPNSRYYYRLTSLLNTSSGPLEGPPGAYVTYTPVTRIERAWSDLTQIKPGMSLLGLEWPPYGAGYEIRTMFDNSLSTFPDTSPAARNPAVGVNLGRPHVIQFMRHVARNTAYGATRLNGAELRGSNSPDYTNSFTRLATFAGATAGSLVTQQTVTQEAFQYIFVQRPDANEFWGNIAELELYGYAPGDINAVFRAPDAVTLSIALGGVRLDWAAYPAADTYRVERSADGAGGWVDLGDTQGAASFTDPDPILFQRSFYRVVAVRGQGQSEEVAYSGVYDIIAYTPGNGTGLTAAYYTSYALAYNPGEACAATFVEPAPYWDIGSAATPVRPDVPGSTENFRVVWYGDLTAPATTNYTLYVTSDDGVALWVDDRCVINRWVTRSAATDQATLALTGGVHRIRVDYFQGGGGKTMKLEWKWGALDRAVIPTLQLTPLPLPAGEDVFLQTGPWQGRTINAQRLGFHTLNPDGSLTVGSTGGDMWAANENYHYVWQTIHGDFLFEAKVDEDIDLLRTSGKGILMVRNAIPGGSPFLAATAACTPWNGATGKFTVKQRLPPDPAVTEPLLWTGPWINPCHLRIKRAGNVFTFAYRDAAPGSPWVELHTFADTGGIFAKDLYAGVAVSANVDSSPNMFQTVTFSEIILKRINTGTVLMIR